MPAERTRRVSCSESRKVASLLVASASIVLQGAVPYTRTTWSVRGMLTAGRRCRRRRGASPC